jgi:glycosyltransferase involved in cell wall biosynthesis
MNRGTSLGVVIPAHNEEGFVGRVIETLPSFVDRAYVVDDASTDGTWGEIQRHAELVNGPPSPDAVANGGRQFDPYIVTIRHDENRGVGGAIKTGYRRAREDGIDVIAVMAGDGQMDPDYLDRIVDPVIQGRADYAKGSRLLRKEYREEMSRWRFFGNSVLTFLTKVSTGYWRLTDPQNGYTALSMSVFDSIDLDALYDDYGFANDLLAKLNVIEARIVDVPIPARYGDEQSDIRYSRFVPRLSGLLLRNFLWRMKARYLVADFHPLVFLYALGVAGAMVGLGALGWALWAPDRTGVHGLLSVVVLLLGGLFVTLAMVFDRQANAGLESGVHPGVGERR